VIDPDFWRLLVTISATMIGLVFLGTIYYLESGAEEFDVFQREMEALTVSAAQLIIVYFSTALVLSLFQEPFLPTGLTMLGYIALAAGVVVITRSANRALRSFEDAPQSDTWDPLLLRLSRVSNWVAFIAVFVAPIVVFHDAGSVLSAGDDLGMAELSVAWSVVLALLFGYWNLVQFLLLPYEVREQERKIREATQSSQRADDLVHEGIPTERSENDELLP
jgi:hypothetical protein